jgi:F-type H+-transporting ATPase subunit delta
MNDSKIPVRYAKALFELTEAKGITEDVFKDVKDMKVLVGLPEMKEVLTSPVFSSGEKKKLMLSVTGKINQYTKLFVEMVFNNKRETYFEAIFRDYADMYKKSRKIKSVELTTAVKIDETLKEQFKQQILVTFNADITLETKVDKDIIGGFIVQVDDLFYDASVKKQLKNFEKALIREKL